MWEQPNWTSWSWQGVRDGCCGQQISTQALGRSDPVQKGALEHSPFGELYCTPALLLSGKMYQQRGCWWDGSSENLDPNRSRTRPCLLLGGWEFWLGRAVASSTKSFLLSGESRGIFGSRQHNKVAINHRRQCPAGRRKSSLECRDKGPLKCPN